MSLFTRLLCVAALVEASACTRQLAPAPIPAAIMPAFHVSAEVRVSASGQGQLTGEASGQVTGAVTGSVTGEATAGATGQATIQATGKGRLIVDVAEGPVPVYRVRFDASKQDNGTRRASYRFFELPFEKVCDATPCVIEEAPSNILIGFPVLGCRPAVDFDLVHVGLSPSVYRRSLAIFEDDTGAERIVGIVAASLGAAASITGIVLLPTGYPAAGGITLGAGALALTAGILMIRHDSATYRPGSANHFEASVAPGGTIVVEPPNRRSPLEVYPYYDCSWGSRQGGTG